MVATKQEWLQSLREADHKHDRMLIVPRLIVALLFVAGLALFAGKVFAEPVAQASNGKVTVTVYSEKCTHPDHVTNLPNRATWKEGDKVFDGCGGIDRNLGIAIFWFTDVTVFVLPLQAFSPLTGA